ncbi:hypothetical protein ACX1DW_01400 [Stutzerimonas sp. KH-1]|jgi:hypothetical protein
MHTDKAIAEFEAWWDRQPHREQFEDVKDQMRNVWLASRREAFIELPQPATRPCDCDRCDCGNIGDAQAVAEADAFNCALAQCQNAIEAAGVTVRGGER